MAYITDTTHSFGASLTAALNTVANSVVAIFTDLSAASSRAQFLEELQAMDDETLMATHSISRGEIVAYVFHDKLVP